MRDPTSSEEFAVLWPGGPLAVPAVPPAPRPASLDGKTVAFVWDDMFRGDEIFPIIAEAIAATADDVRFVGHEAFGSTFGGDEHAVLAALPDRLREHEVDAVVSGVGC